jgi:hypothetical protein
MTQGIRIYRPDGKVAYDSNMVTWNQLGTLRTSLGGANQARYPAAVGRETLTLMFFVDAPPVDHAAIAPTVSLINGVLDVSGGSESVVVMAMAR